MKTYSIESKSIIGWKNILFANTPVHVCACVCPCICVCVHARVCVCVCICVHFSAQKFSRLLKAVKGLEPFIICCNVT